MASPPKTSRTANDLEYLDVEQAANICSVSDERFAKWIEKGLVPVIEHGSKRLVRAHDLIQHLIRHNIPIPERLLQGSSKKILFILMQPEIPPAMTTDIIWALYQIHKQPSYIFDFIEYDDTTELKIITFDPDIIVLLQKEGDVHTALQNISKMPGRSIPVHSLSADRAIDLKTLLND